MRKIVFFLISTLVIALPICVSQVLAMSIKDTAGTEIGTDRASSVHYTVPQLAPVPASSKTSAAIAFHNPLVVMRGSSPIKGRVNQKVKPAIQKLCGQNIQIVFLPQTNPARDLRLHPFKGETLVIYEKEMTYQGWSHRGGGVRTYSYPETYEITRSFPVYGTDFLTIVRGLKTHDYEYIDKPTEFDLIAELDYNATRTALKGALVQDCLVLDLPALDLQIAAPVLKAIEAGASQMGADRVNVSIPSTDKTLITFLRENGYKSFGETIDFDSWEVTHRSYKTLPPQQPFILKDLEVAWQERGQEEAPWSPHRFGLFVREANTGKVVGGLCWRIACPSYTPYHPPYAEGNGFWLDPTLRREKLGTVLLSHAKAYIKQKGINLVELCTSDFEAPGFYRKMGFTVRPLYKDYLRNRKGDLATSYICQLALTE